MRRKVILKAFRYYIRWEKRFKGKPSLTEYILFILVAAAITLKFKGQLEQKLFESDRDRFPATDRIYDYIEPQSQLPIHEHMKTYGD